MGIIKYAFKIWREKQVRQKILLILGLLFIGAIPLVGIEVAARHFYKENHLDKILNVIKEDSVLFWKNRPNLDLEFYGARIHTDSLGFRFVSKEDKWEQSKNRLLVLGPSPCFGWGVSDEDTYSSILQRELALKKIDISVKNASQIGFSSYQGKLLFENLMNSKMKSPTHIFITYIVNDLDYRRFYYSGPVEDDLIYPRSKTIVMINNFVSDLSIYKVIRNMLQKNSDNNLKYIQRVSPSLYRKNIDEIISLAKKKNIKVYLGLYPLKLPESPSTKLINQSVELYHAEMKSIAKKTGASLVDLVTVLAQAESYPYIDKRYDTFHPNTYGHRLIANKLVSIIESELNH
jgi:lysophospholipase L1-like esterase